MKKVEMKLKKRKLEVTTDSFSAGYTSNTTATMNELNISEIEREGDT